MHILEDVNLAKCSPREKVVLSVKEWIKSGQLGQGDLLPTEMGLSKMLNVSRGTVRTGLELLEEQHLISRNKGRGCIVSLKAVSTPNPMANTVIILTRNRENPFLYRDTGYLKAVEASTIETLSQQGIHTFSMQEATLQESEISQILSTPPRGVIIMEDFFQTEKGQRIFETMKDKGINIVVSIDNPDVKNFDRVISDSEEGAYLLTNYLIEKGCRKILRFWGYLNDHFWVQDRDKGYERAIGEADLEIIDSAKFPPGFLPPGTAYSKDNFELRMRAFAGFLAEHLTGSVKPDAIMLSTDLEVPVIGAACKLFNVVPGKDILITGYDNKWDDCQLKEFETTPPVASIDKNNQEIGQAMVKLLDDRIAGNLPQEAQCIKIKPQICYF